MKSKPEHITFYGEKWVPAERQAGLETERDEARALIKAIGHEIDAMRSQASAADARRVAAEHRAQRIVLDAELKSRAEAAEAALRALQQQVQQVGEKWRSQAKEEARKFYSPVTTDWNNIRTIEGRTAEHCANELAALPGLESR